MLPALAQPSSSLSDSYARIWGSILPALPPLNVPIHSLYTRSKGWPLFLWRFSRFFGIDRSCPLTYWKTELEPRPRFENAQRHSVSSSSSCLGVERRTRDIPHSSSGRRLGLQSHKPVSILSPLLHTQADPRCSVLRLTVCRRVKRACVQNTENCLLIATSASLPHHHPRAYLQVSDHHRQPPQGRLELHEAWEEHKKVTTGIEPAIS